MGKAFQFGVARRVIQQKDCEEYSGYYGKVDNDDSQDATNDAGADYQLNEKESDDAWAWRIGEAVSAQTKQMAFGETVIDTEQEIINLVNWPISFFVNAARSRKLWEHVGKRGGSGMYFNTEYKAMINSFNCGSDKTEFSNIWCKSADQKLAAQEYTGKQYNVRGVDNNQFQMLCMGTPVDLLSFISS